MYLLMVLRRSKLTDEVVRGPETGRAGTVDQALLGDLKEAERASRVRRRVAADLGQVVGDRAVVALWPGVPLQLQGVASLDRDGGRGGLGRLVAGDVRGAEGVGLDEAVVL